MTALKTAGAVWPPKQVRGLYKRKPHLKTRWPLARAHWDRDAKLRAGDAWTEAMRDFQHVMEPPGQDEWGDEKQVRLWSYFQRRWRKIFQGDCDDAIPRGMEKLMGQGFERASMRLLIGDTPRGHHMVLGLEVIENGQPGSIIFDHRHEGFRSYREGPTHPDGDLNLRIASVPGAFFWTNVVN